MTAALTDSLKAHAETLAAAEQSAAQQNRKHWDRLQQGAAQNAEALALLQKAVTEQGAVLNRAVEAAGRVTSLEEALNRNLASLAGARNFEQTVISLAAAIHLLNGRLGQLPDDAPRVELEPAKRTGQAA
jgi:hypothetical protein